mmetsp:Transcript_8943/g.26008  ORF Transcript_8943/g.26008 Transcript_8943/m.26008 type:complete len:329 (-) Transcript_8943:922-1908(-)
MFMAMGMISSRSATSVITLAFGAEPSQVKNVPTRCSKCSLMARVAAATKRGPELSMFLATWWQIASRSTSKRWRRISDEPEVNARCTASCMMPTPTATTPSSAPTSAASTLALAMMFARLGVLAAWPRQVARLSSGVIVVRTFSITSWRTPSSIFALSILLATSLDMSVSPNARSTLSSVSDEGEGPSDTILASTSSISVLRCSSALGTQVERICEVYSPSILVSSAPMPHCLFEMSAGIFCASPSNHSRSERVDVASPAASSSSTSVSRFLTATHPLGSFTMSSASPASRVSSSQCGEFFLRCMYFWSLARSALASTPNVTVSLEHA